MVGRQARLTLAGRALTSSEEPVKLLGAHAEQVQSRLADALAPPVDEPGEASDLA